jgi:hypothetical protein
MLRRAEFNGRKPATDLDAWSVRRTAVYHQRRCYYDSPLMEGVSETPLNIENKSMFFLISPSENAENHLEKCCEPSRMSPWTAQRILIADSLRGWGDYMALLETHLNTQARNIPRPLKSA